MRKKLRKIIMGKGVMQNGKIGKQTGREMKKIMKGKGRKARGLERKGREWRRMSREKVKEQGNGNG